MDPRPARGTVFVPQTSPADEPARRSVEHRRLMAVREADVTREICAAYPNHGDPVVIRMNNTGTILRTGFRVALATILRGDAELVLTHVA